MIESSSFNKNRHSRHTIRALDILDGEISRSNAVHQSLLENQSQALRTITDIRNFSASNNHAIHIRELLFSKEHLEEFATGSIAKCFGPEYKVLDQRKSPRIPNGLLLLIDRVTEISGERQNLNPPASITTEFDIKDNAWFIQESNYPGIPLSILMEIALQPCGILSAYLGTSLVIPAENNLFRNLDGNIKFYSTPDLRGKTVTNKAELIKTISSGGLYIQEFRFELSVSGSTFLAGESSFGYFTQGVMDKQSGLDLAEKRLKITGRQGFPEDYISLNSEALLSLGESQTGRHLDLTDHIWLSKDGGRSGQGVVIGQKSLKGNEWFFKNHFYQDPVMPGSLGIEAIAQGLWAIAADKTRGSWSDYTLVDFACEEPVRWKYRGQVTPENRNMYFEVHIKERSKSVSFVELKADADFWVGDVRIYSVENISMRFKENRAR